MRLRITTRLIADINFEDYGIDSNLSDEEKINKLRDYMNDSGDEILMLLETNDSSVDVEEVKPGEE